jgi:hypothetical protein
MAPENMQPADNQYPLVDGGLLALNIRPLEGRTIEAFIKQNLPEGASLTYQRRKANWLAYSGYYGDDIFYGRTHLSCGDTNAHSFIIRYPRSKRALYDRVVERMSHSFQVSREFQRANCQR